MQLNLTTGAKDGLVQHCEWDLAMAPTTISGNADLLSEFKARINDAYSETLAFLQSLDTNWPLDDSNYVLTQPLTITLQNGTNVYSLPAIESGTNVTNGIMGVESIAVIDQAGVIHVLAPTDELELTLDQNYSTPGLPTLYRFKGETVKLWPAPATGSVTLTNGLKFYPKRASKNLVSDTDEPNILKPCQHLIHLGASLGYAISRQLASAGNLANQLNQKRQEAKTLYLIRGRKINGHLKPYLADCK